ncbi:MAG: fatty acid desaturase [Pseudomonadota bacterium]
MLRHAEWPTIGLLAACYTLWVGAVVGLAETAILPATCLAALAIAFHSSLTHEIVHGHPFRDARANAALVFPTLTLVIPLGRFRDLHMAHHRDSDLTDPYDDPESNYLDPVVWATLPAPVRLVLQVNNTLAGRMVIGPAVSQVAFLAQDWRRIREGAPEVLNAWLWHIPQAGSVVTFLVVFGSMPWWAYGLAIYGGIALLKIRTFLEHQAHERVPGRTVIIEDRGWLALLFLNNNFHVVHHMHPAEPWYRLPGRYLADRARYLNVNGGYRYASYADVFRKHLFAAKDPVAHPLYPGKPR